MALDCASRTAVQLNSNGGLEPDTSKGRYCSLVPHLESLSFFPLGSLEAYKDMKR